MEKTDINIDIENLILEKINIIFDDKFVYKILNVYNNDDFDKLKQELINKVIKILLFEIDTINKKIINKDKKLTKELGEINGTKDSDGAFPGFEESNDWENITGEINGVWFVKNLEQQLKKQLIKILKN